MDPPPPPKPTFQHYFLTSYEHLFCKISADRSVYTPQLCEITELLVFALAWLSFTLNFVNKYQHKFSRFVSCTFNQILQWYFSRMRYVVGTCTTQPPIQWVPRAIPLVVRRPGHEADNSRPSSAQVKEWVELYLHFPSTSSWRDA
jgi:hypothetical protein